MQLPFMALDPKTPDFICSSLQSSARCGIMDLSIMKLYG